MPTVQYSPRPFVANNYMMPMKYRQYSIRFTRPADKSIAVIYDPKGKVHSLSANSIDDAVFAAQRWIDRQKGSQRH